MLDSLVIASIIVTFPIAGMALMFYWLCNRCICAVEKEPSHQPYSARYQSTEAGI